MGACSSKRNRAAIQPKPRDAGNASDALNVAATPSQSATLQQPDASQPVAHSEACALRIVHITDVYTLENFPSLRTLIVQKRQEFAQQHGSNSKTISMLTGDFLMPYLLSTVDKGRGMMTMLNETPIDYLTWGNHEADMAHSDVMAREREYKGTWINSNMQSHESFATSTCQKDAAWIDLQASNGSSHARKVAMIGVMTNSSSKPGAFGGATIDDPWECMAKFSPKLKAEGADLVIPLCHLYEPQDERTARDFDFPLILSGHDHHTVDKVVDGSRILKPGLDAIKAIVIDIVWPASGALSPTISAEFFNTADFPPDGPLEGKVRAAYTLIDNLRNTQLTVVPDRFRPLTSEDARGRNCTMGTYMCSVIRDALNSPTTALGDEVDCVLIKAGSCPRASKTYKPDEHITLETLQMEIQEPNEIFVFQVSGKAIKYGVCEQWGGLPNPGWMQYDDGVEIDAEGLVASIGGEPLDEERVYNVGSPIDFTRKSDGKTIGEWFEQHPHLVPDHDTGFPPHALLMKFWAEQLWDQVFHILDRNNDGEMSQEELAQFDTDGDGKLSKQELLDALSRQGFKTYEGETTFVDVLIQAAGDADGDGTLTVGEINRERTRRNLLREQSSSRKLLHAREHKSVHDLLNTADA